MQAVILCGGMGTRTQQAAIPKALLPVAGKPFIDHQLSWLCKCGVEMVVLCTGHMGEQLTNYVGNGRRYGPDFVVKYSRDAISGTINAIRNARVLLDEWFFVINGDTHFLDLDLSKTCKREFLFSRKSAYVARRADKDCGIYAMEHRLISALNKEFIYFPNAIKDLERFDLVHTDQVDWPFYDMGTPSGMAKLEEKLCSRQNTTL